MDEIEDRCDLLDLLEEAAVTRRSVRVQLESGDQFTDHVRDVVTESGEDYAQFNRHGRIPVSDIRSAGRAAPGEEDTVDRPGAPGPDVSSPR